MTIDPDLNESNEATLLARQAATDPALVASLIDGIGPAAKKTTIRHASFDALMNLAKNHPEMLLPYWDQFTNLLSSSNNSTLYCVVYLLAALTPAVPVKQFDLLLEPLYALLDGSSVMVASHVAAVSGQIVQARPDLEERITALLLAPRKSPLESERQDLVKSYAIEAMDTYFDIATQPDAIIGFVWRQLDCASPKTRKAAENFLKKHG